MLVPENSVWVSSDGAGQVAHRANGTRSRTSTSGTDGAADAITVSPLAERALGRVFGQRQRLEFGPSSGRVAVRHWRLLHGVRSRHRRQ